MRDRSSGRLTPAARGSCPTFPATSVTIQDTNVALTKQNKRGRKRRGFLFHKQWKEKWNRKIRQICDCDGSLTRELNYVTIWLYIFLVASRRRDRSDAPRRRPPHSWPFCCSVDSAAGPGNSSFTIQSDFQTGAAASRIGKFTLRRGCRRRFPANSYGTEEYITIGILQGNMSRYNTLSSEKKKKKLQTKIE